MSRLPLDQRDELRAAIYHHESLRQILSRIEQQQRVVFHEQRPVDEQAKAEAEEILIADIVTRFQGRIEEVRDALSKLEQGGKSRQQAVSEYATYIHNYYTMPLGVILRKHLWGRDESQPARSGETALVGTADPGPR